jgi:hypothetical protein
VLKEAEDDTSSPGRNHNANPNTVAIRAIPSPQAISRAPGSLTMHRVAASKRPLRAVKLIKTKASMRGDRFITLFVQAKEIR